MVLLGMKGAMVWSRALQGYCVKVHQGHLKIISNRLTNDKKSIFIYFSKV